MLVAVVALCLSQAPIARISDAPLVNADVQLPSVGGRVVKSASLWNPVVQLETEIRVERKRTWGAVLFWTGAGIIASGMYLIVQSAQGPEPLRPMFGRQAVVTSTAGVALLAGGVGLNISADYDVGG
jgi:hypothetical protein